MPKKWIMRNKEKEEEQDSEWECLNKQLAAAADILFLKHASSIFRQSSSPVCGISMRELCWLAHGKLP